MRKILFIDVDGTLCSPVYNKPPHSAVEAIRQARKNGHLAYICTGRSKAEVYEDIWAIGLDGMIGGNGCYVENHGKVILHKKLTEEECRDVVDWCRERNMEFYQSGKSTTPDRLDQTWMNCLNLFDAEYNV